MTENKPEPELDADLFDQLRAVEKAHQAGGSAAAADGQRAMQTEGAQVWRSNPHKLPADREQRQAWLRGYGNVLAWWGGDKGDSDRN